jgi:hypothetical protein
MCEKEEMNGEKYEHMSGRQGKKNSWTAPNNQTNEQQHCQSACHLYINISTCRREIERQRHEVRLLCRIYQMEKKKQEDVL